MGDQSNCFLVTWGIRIWDSHTHVVIVKTTLMQSKSSQAFSLSNEEEDALHRSTKKIKEGHDPSPPNQNLSYKEKLVGQLPGAYKSAFSLVDSMQEDADSDVEESDLEEGTVALALSKEEKLGIQSQWSKALIVKTFGRTVGYQFLSQRVRELWKPSNGLDLFDLGHDYFLAHFESNDDLDHVLKNGPWPLIKNILIGKFKQQVTYEGIHSLCFSCGRLGHKKEHCQYTIRETQQAVSQEQQRSDNSSPCNASPTPATHSSEPSPIGSSPPADKPDSFGPWLLVAWKKPTGKPRPNASFTRQGPIHHSIKIQRKAGNREKRFDHSSQNREEPSDTKGKRKLVTSTSHIQKLTIKPNSKPTSSSNAPTAQPKRYNEKQTRSRVASSPQWPMQILPYSPNNLDSAGCSNTPFSFQAQTETHTPHPLSTSTTNQLSTSYPSEPYPQNAVGHMAQEQSCRAGGLHDQQYKMGPTDDLRMYKQRATGSLELHLSTNREEHARWVPSSDRSDMALHAQSMVEIHTGQAATPALRSEDLQQLKMSLGEQPLRSIARSNGERDSATRDMSKEILDGGVNGSTNSGNSTSTETNANIDCNSELHHRHPDQANSTEPSRACYHSDAGNPCGRGELTTGGWNWMTSRRAFAIECESFEPHLSPKMNILVWNCRGAMKPSFRSSICDLTKFHAPGIVVVTETCISGSRAREILRTLPYDGIHTTDSIGYAGGTWLLWCKDMVDLEVLAATK
uniref:CCHC-type domain-containing protein n=1 Tax=Quercus lobata TaxID=97700 RepID=A0A7N2LJ76_QUELO